MRPLVLLYVLQLTLLATHQVDAAYWHEWDVFGVPGGITFFLVFNVAAMLVLGQGLVFVASGSPHRSTAVLVCAATGLVTCALHAVFLARDPVAFWAPASLAILGAILVTALAQLGTLWRDARTSMAPLFVTMAAQPTSRGSSRSARATCGSRRAARTSTR
jgi:hypothetical protein